MIRTIKFSALLLAVSAFSVIGNNSYARDIEKALNPNIIIPFSNTLATKFKVKGTIVSAGSSETLSGILIKEKGTSVTTITDSNGNFLIQVSTPNAILEVSSPKYQKQEVSVNNNSQLSIKLDENVIVNDENVVIAYGSQKKADLVGSVTSVKIADLKIPSSNLTTAFAGRVAGIIAYQRSGEPGQDNADFFIRGVNTFGYKTSPLILIDGFEMTIKDLARLQPEDISSFSVLKDATATAMYGFRGANGVILATTTQGKIGKMRLSFRVENSFSSPTQNVEFADPVTYMRLANEAVVTRNPLSQLIYSEKKIDNTAAGVNAVAFPANDWNKIMFRDITTVQRMNLNLNGGGRVVRYFISGSYTKDNGLMKVDKRNNFNNNIDLKSYTLRSNINIDVTKSTEVTVRLSGNFDDYQGPLTGGADLYSKAMKSNPVLFPAYYPADKQHQSEDHIMFGNYQFGQYVNPYAEMVRGYKNYSNSLMLAQLEAKQDLSFLTKGLSFRIMANSNLRSYSNESRQYSPFYYSLYSFDAPTNTYEITPINPSTGTEELDNYKRPKTNSSSYFLESTLNYYSTFDNKHSISGLLVYTMQNNKNENGVNSQQSLPVRNMGLAGRATYSYSNRYFGELNFGYTGSEQFYKKNRFGFFPSVGVAWSVSSEKFFEHVKPVVSNLRIKATYGLTGNDAITSDADRFIYLSGVNMNDANKGATFGIYPGGQTLNGITINNYGNQNITWERSVQKNIALEISLFKKLNIQAEYYTQQRDQILMYLTSLPSTMGISKPVRANVGATSGKGVDVSANYQETFHNGINLSFTANYTFSASKITAYEEPKYNESYLSRLGNSIFQTYGYVAERLFADDSEVANSPNQPFGPYGRGDIKYLNVNKDKQINADDKFPIGKPTLPETTYGFGFSVGYKGFDASLFFEGIANVSFWIDAVATSPFQNQTQILKAYAENYWSDNNQNTNALWPRLSPTLNSNNTQTSTWFMRDGSFLRLKHVEIGYEFPEKLKTFMHTSNFRVYINATNLLNFSKFKLWDAEMGSNGLGYPIQKVFNIGLNLTFN